MSEKNNNKAVLRKIVRSIKGHWRDIMNFGVIGFLGLIIAYQNLIIDRNSLIIARSQLLLEQIQQPTLEYTYHLRLSQRDERAIVKAADELMSTFFMYSQELESPLAPHYKEFFAEILPMTVTVPAQPISVSIQIENAGPATGETVRTFVEMDQPITSYQVKTLEPYRVIEGGAGEHKITLEIDRLATGDIADIDIGVEAATSDTQRGQLVLSSVSPSEWEVPEEITDKWSSFLPGSPQRLPLWPQLYLIPAQEPNVEVVVTHSKGRATMRSP